MPDFKAGKRDAGPRVTGGGLSLGSLVCHYDPALPAVELSALPGEETAN